MGKEMKGRAFFVAVIIAIIVFAILFIGVQSTAEFSLFLPQGVTGLPIGPLGITFNQVQITTQLECFRTEPRCRAFQDLLIALVRLNVASVDEVLKNANIVIRDSAGTVIFTQYGRP